MTISRNFFVLDDFNLSGKRVLLRLDINSPMDPITGEILDDSRMRSHIDTIEDLSRSKVIILAHQSKPGKKDFTNLKNHAARLSKLIHKPIKYVDSLFDSRAIQEIEQMKNGEIIMLENTRFYAEELLLKNAKTEVMAKSHMVSRLSSVADYCVCDAFAAAHRAQPSLVGFGEAIPTMAGRLMERELDILGKVMKKGSGTLAILGGAKVDDSIDVMGNMLDSGSIAQVLTGGLVATIFLKAKGIDPGPGSISILEREISDYENLVTSASQLLEKYPDKIQVPTDVALSDNGQRIGLTVDQLPQPHPIFDIGLDTIVKYIDHIYNANNIILNGPLGVFEMEEFSFGTIEIFKAIADSDAFSVVGGGHTGTMVKRLGLQRMIDHTSTGGGALINMLSGKTLPVVESLKRSKLKFSVV
ncbi:MAG: phosphoglycerate kinase [Thermoplasmata archaeon]|nr:phosphoglycerate kinase [Thermoplasmata archaeon]